MLGEFLLQAASAYESTGHEDAVQVARLLRQVDTPDNWKTVGQKPHQPSLARALASDDCLAAATPLALTANNMNWIDSSGLPKTPDQFKGDYCFTAIIGPAGWPESLVLHEEFRFGVYLQDPQTFYPSHMHEAVELYLPVSGTAMWQKDDQPFAAINAGTLIHHKTYQPHATKTGDEPMLAFWAWLGNLSIDTYSFVNS